MAPNESSSESASSSTSAKKAPSLSNSDSAAQKDSWTLSASYDYSVQKRSRRLTDWIVDHPGVVVGVTFLVVAICGAIYVGGGVDTGIEQRSGQILALNDLVVKHFIANDAHDARQTSNEDRLPRSTTVRDYTMVVFYESITDGNMFTPANLKRVWEHDMAVVGDRMRCPGCSAQIEDYRQFCRVDYVKAEAENKLDDVCSSSGIPLNLCTPPQSPVTMFLNNTDFWSLTEEDVDGITQERIDRVLQSLTDEQIRGPAGVFLDKDFSTVDDGLTNLRSRFTRSFFEFGLPLCNSDSSAPFRNEYDNRAEQNRQHREFVAQYYEFFLQDDPTGIKVDFFEEEYFTEEVTRILDNDTTLAIAAAAFVLLGIWIQTRSLFIALAGILNIGAAYPISLVFYHGVFGIQLDPPMNLLAVFIILGVGADDIFIMIDTWKQSYHQGENVTASVKHQLNWTWCRSTKAMGITTFTTLFAFLMSGAAPIPTVQTFGYFAAMMSIFNYLLVITYFPAIIVLWNKRLEHQCFFKPIAHDGKTQDAAHISKGADVDEPNEEEVTSIVVPSENDKEAEHDADRSQDVDVSSYRLLERFFYSHFAPNLYHFRRWVAAVFTLIFILGAVGSGFVKLPAESRSLIPDDADSSMAFETAQNFADSSVRPELYVFYGVQPDDPVDRSGVDRNDLVEFGALNIDSEFAAKFSASNQRALVDICDRIVETQVDGDIFVSRGVHSCVIRDYKAWESNEFGDETDDLNELSARMFRFVSEDATRQAVQQIGFEFSNSEPRLTHIRLAFSQPLALVTAHDVRELWFNRWSDLIDSINDDAPDGLQNAFHTNYNWARYATNNLVVSTTVLSLGLSLIVALACLVIATQNLIIAALAWITILGIVLTVVGLFTAAGYELDIVRAVMYYMLVGLSVDYVVHLGNAYAESHASGRYNRAREALLDVGISILGAALTTMGSGVFLLVASTQFFIQFGTTLLVTVFLTFLWSTMGFVVLLMFLGPTDASQGNVILLWKRCFGKSARKSSQDLGNAKDDRYLEGQTVQMNGKQVEAIELDNSTSTSNNIERVAPNGVDDDSDNLDNDIELSEKLENDDRSLDTALIDVSGKNTETVDVKRASLSHKA